MNMNTDQSRAIASENAHQPAAASASRLRQFTELGRSRLEDAIEADASQTIAQP